MALSVCACGGPTLEEQVAEAIPVFSEDEGQAFFTENKDQFEVVSGDAVADIFLSKSTWNIVD